MPCACLSSRWWTRKGTLRAGRRRVVGPRADSRSSSRTMRLARVWATFRAVRASRLLTNVVVDALVAVLVVGAQIEVWTTELPGARGWDALAVAGWTVPLFFRRRFPLAAPLAVFTAIAVAGFIEPKLPPDTLSTT